MSETVHGSALPRPGYSKHRIEGLTDGIFAVAMTLLALELKFPEHTQLATSEELVVQMAHLLPQLISWTISFAILGIFWFSHQRAYSYLRMVDGKLMVINLVTLGFITLLPFSTMLIGTYTGLFAAHVAYATIMVALAGLSIWQINYIHNHRDIAQDSLTLATVQAVRFRCWSLIACGVLAVVVAWYKPHFSSMAFMLMAVLSPWSRRLERRAGQQPAGPPAAAPH